MSETKPLRLGKALQACLRFERFVNEHDVDPRDLAELLTWARRAFRTGEQACNTGNHDREDGAAARFVLRKNGRDVELPCIE
jgi:hypothetical protein